MGYATCFGMLLSVYRAIRTGQVWDAFVHGIVTALGVWFTCGLIRCFAHWLTTQETDWMTLFVGGEASSLVWLSALSWIHSRTTLVAHLPNIVHNVVFSFVLHVRVPWMLLAYMALLWISMIVSSLLTGSWGLVGFMVWRVMVVMLMENRARKYWKHLQ
jgi:hypothetical protein